MRDQPANRTFEVITIDSDEDEEIAGRSEETPTPALMPQTLDDAGRDAYTNKIQQIVDETRATFVVSDAVAGLSETFVQRLNAGLIPKVNRHAAIDERTHISWTSEVDQILVQLAIDGITNGRNLRKQKVYKQWIETTEKLQFVRDGRRLSRRLRQLCQPEKNHQLKLYCGWSPDKTEQQKRNVQITINHIRAAVLDMAQVESLGLKEFVTVSSPKQKRRRS